MFDAMRPFDENIEFWNTHTQAENDLSLDMKLSGKLAHLKSILVASLSGQINNQ